MPVYAHTRSHTPYSGCVCVFVCVLVPGQGMGIYLANAENTLDLFAFDFARCQRHFEEFSTFDKVKGLFASR